MHHFLYFLLTTLLVKEIEARQLLGGAKRSVVTMSIDSHLHVWGDGTAPFPYLKDPPPGALVPTGSPENLLKLMEEAGVEGALIVQPINYLYDHSFVKAAIDKYPNKFKGMCLLDPSCDADYLPKLKAEGFGSVRFNPYLPEWNGAKMSDAAGQKLFSQCGELGLPVGFMCFQGLGKHAEEITSLLEASPSTVVVVDHFGFFVQNGKVEEDSWAKLIALAQYPQVNVKISAAFRNVVSKADSSYPELTERLRSLLSAYGPSRVMWGSDFPFVILEAPNAYAQSLANVASWGLSHEDERHWVTRGTAEKVFGKWGASHPL